MCIRDRLILGTGSYLILRGRVALTACREFELRAERASGATGSLSNYNQLAAMLPQTTPVLYTYIENRPDGYSGAWLGPILVLKSQLPSSFKAQERRNLHTITMVISTVDVPNNPLYLSGPLSRILAYHCTCKSGSGTNRSCAHVMGVVMGLLAPECFKSVKKKTGLLTDISLPLAQQPTLSGKLD